MSYRPNVHNRAKEWLWKFNRCHEIQWLPRALLSEKISIKNFCSENLEILKLIYLFIFPPKIALKFKIKLICEFHLNTIHMWCTLEVSGLSFGHDRIVWNNLFALKIPEFIYSLQTTAYRNLRERKILPFGLKLWRVGWKGPSMAEVMIKKEQTEHRFYAAYSQTLTLECTFCLNKHWQILTQAVFLRRKHIYISSAIISYIFFRYLKSFHCLFCQLSLGMWETDSFARNQGSGLVSLSGLGWPKAMTRVNKEASWQVS